MNVHLNVFICDKGVVTRNEFKLPSVTNEGLKEHPEYAERFIYGNDDFTDGTDKVLVWYTLSLEPHEEKINKESKY